MPSPFPGMNPYLEQDVAWQDFHQSFIVFLRNDLAAQLAPAYTVKIEEHLYIHELTNPDAQFFFAQADLGLAKSEKRAVRSRGAVLEAPAHGRLPFTMTTEHHSYLEIRGRGHRDIVTVIEMVSPSNKYAGSDRDVYLAKRNRLLRSQTHLVEIDFLRGGPRLPLEDMPPCDYCALVSRWEERPDVAVWPIRLRDRLPIVPVPLRAPDADARADLQKILHQAYDSARYGEYIYEESPKPALSKHDRAWAQQILREGKRRTPKRTGR